MARALLRVWRAQLDDILGQMSPESTLPTIDWAAFEEAQREVLEPYIQHGVEWGLQQGAGEVGLSTRAKAAPELGMTVDWNLVNENAVNWASNYTFDLVGGITQTTQTALQSAISGWLEAGAAYSELEKRVREIFDNPQRAALISVTEGTRAIAEGNTQAWQAVNVWGREWRTAQDELVCPICGGLNHQRQPLGMSFDVVAEGQRYTPDNPPAHPDCRCTVVPIVRAPGG